MTHPAAGLKEFHWMNRMPQYFPALDSFPAFILFIVAMVCSPSLAANSVSAHMKISAQAEHALSGSGTTVVLVGLSVPGRSSPHSPTTGKRQIADLQARVVAAVSGTGFELLHSYRTVPYITAKVSRTGVKRLAGHPEVRAIGRDIPVEGATAQSAVFIGADRVVDELGVTGVGVTVGLIDSGIDTFHPDLDKAVVDGFHFLDAGQDTGSAINDENGHGTHLAGVITSNGTNFAPRGIAPDSKLVVIKALDATLNGHTSDIVSGIDWIVDNHANFPELKFINMSIVITDPLTICPCDQLAVPGQRGYELAYELFMDAVNRAMGAGILIVASAGNDGDSGDHRAPGCFTPIMSVGAIYDAAFTRAPPQGFSDFSDPLLGGAGFTSCVDNNVSAGDLACFSSRGPCVDYVAPGYLISGPASSVIEPFPNPPGRLASFGTSVSAAHVTGVLALIQAADPGMDAFEISNIMFDRADDFPDPGNPLVHYKNVNAYNAVGSITNAAADKWTIFY
jgi:subtilisin family serine protease